MHMCQGEGLGSRLLGLHTVAWSAYCRAILRAMHLNLGGGRGGQGAHKLTAAPDSQLSTQQKQQLCSICRSPDYSAEDLKVLCQGLVSLD